jgi:hypothetical protein
MPSFYPDDALMQVYNVVVTTCILDETDVYYIMYIFIYIHILNIFTVPIRAGDHKAYTTTPLHKRRRK